MDTLDYLVIGALLLLPISLVLWKRYRSSKESERIAQTFWDSDAAEKWREEFDSRNDGK